MSFYKTYRSLLHGLALLYLMIAARMLLSSSLRNAFLAWNIFLAVVPLLCAYYSGNKNSMIRWLLAGTWLLFLPNAMYIITDLVHLPLRSSAFFWFDLVLLFVSAAYGMILGFLSIRRMECMATECGYGAQIPFLRIILMLLCGYGIYLGRIERWNSWDLLVQPVALLRSVLYHARHPFRAQEVWELSTLFGISLLLLYRLLPPPRRETV